MVSRGDIFWAALHPRSGSEQKGNRPVVVLSHDAFNSNPNWNSVIVVPLSTAAKQARRGPTAVELPAGNGIPRASLALCHQVTTLDRAKLTRRIGALPATAMARIEAGLLAALDIRTA